MKHFEVAFTHTEIVIERVPTSRWIVDIALEKLCRLSGCRICWRWPVYRVLNWSINRSGREEFRIPADLELIKKFVEFADIAPDEGYSWTDNYDLDDDETLESA